MREFDLILRMFIHIDRKLDILMGNTDALTAAVSDLGSQDSALLAAVNSSLTDLEAEIAILQTAVGSGDQTSIDAATSTVSQTVTDLKNATAQVTAADPGPQTPPTTPPAAPTS